MKSIYYFLFCCIIISCTNNIIKDHKAICIQYINALTKEKPQILRSQFPANKLTENDALEHIKIMEMSFRRSDLFDWYEIKPVGYITTIDDEDKNRFFMNVIVQCSNGDLFICGRFSVIKENKEHVYMLNDDNIVRIGKEKKATYNTLSDESQVFWF